MRDFFECLYGDGQGYMVVSTENFQNERWFSWPEEADLAVKYCQLRVDQDVYCATTLYSEKQRITANATEGQAVYADADTCVPSNFRKTPSISVETSPGRWHTYWLLDRLHTAAELSAISRKISTAHKEQGCDGGWIPTKLLRVPGTTNHKYPVPFKVMATYTGDLYSLEELEEAYADVEIVNTVTVEGRDLPDLPPNALLEATGKIPEHAWSLYAEPVKDGQSWSERMWKLQLELFREGLTPEEVFIIAKHAKCNKYGDESIGRYTKTGVPIPRRQDPDGTLWAEVLKAHAAYVEPPPADAPVVVEHKLTEVSFLSDEERASLQPTFVDEYVAWVRSKTDAAETYSRTLAFILLSCVYGSWAKILPQFGEVNLNLWALILGDTTRTRKSTAVDLFKQVVHAWEHRMIGDVDTIDIATDFTAEAMTKELGPRDGHVSLVQRDEIQGFFREVFTKTYQAGLLNYLAALYDGKVPVALRATKGNSQRVRAKTVFNMVGVGIVDDVAEILTTKNFRDGFLARFLWATADPPMLTRDAENIAQGNPDDIKDGEDPAITAFCRQFARVQRKFGRGKNVLLFSDEAHKRYEDWKWATALIAQESPHNASLEPSRQRLAFSVWKCAALLAMHDLSDTIEVHHLLPAIAQAEHWYQDMDRMVNKISASDFQRKVTAVENYINEGTDGRRSRAIVYRAMMKTEGLRKAEVDEILDNLSSQGRLNVTRSGKTTYLEVR